MMNMVKYFAVRSFLIFIIAFFLTYAYLLVTKKKMRAKRKLYIALLSAYILAMAFIMFMPSKLMQEKGFKLAHISGDFMGSLQERLQEPNLGINLKAFHTIKSYLKYSDAFNIAINILGNIVIFMPLGYLISKLNKKRNFLKTFLACLTLSVFIEFIQIFIGRSVDVDDVILNSLGGIIGAIIAFL
ncbi:VanZ family protein [Peptoniphilus sp. GNH]|nr:VanZ family protein [Peptoniphilus sp. GNH]